MYAHHFGLSQDPFSIAPDPRYLFMSERHREALAHLLYGVAGTERSAGGAGGGFVLLTGDIGTGKTTVCRCFLEQIPPRCHVAYIFNPKLSVTELLQSVCDEFHITVGHGAGAAPSVKDYIDALNTVLLQTHAVGHSSVLIIDEAQNLAPDVLEQLRLLTNLETSERKLLQIVLIGQPELRTLLARPELEQLAQRVIARFHLNALSPAETTQYIGHRLGVAGHQGPLPFEAGALKRIHQITRGVPRRINLLCGRALLGAWATGQSRVSRPMVDKAATEVFGPELLEPAGSGPSRSAWALGALGLLLGAGLAGLAAWQLRPAAEAAGVALPAGAARATASAASAVALAASAPASNPVAAAASAPAAAGLAALATASGAQAASAPTLALVAASAPVTPPAAPAPVLLTALDTASLRQMHRDLPSAWRALAPAWKLPAVPGDPCEATAAQAVRCYSTGNVSLLLIRQLGRPGILSLYPDRGAPVYAQITGLGGQTATLRLAGQSVTVSLVELGRVWHGDFATYWRPPPGYTAELRDGSTGPAVDWLAARLAKLAGRPAPVGAQVLDAPLKERIQAFQRAQGIRPDGRPGPMTLMQLGRATGADEPRLSTEPQ
jgi:general secretion pathway protein A